MAKISTAEASIKTCSVEVKTITISGKQMTLTVFRQLEREHLVEIADSGDCIFRGTPWGRVNYHPDGCADAPEHMHVVWQKGGELRRDHSIPLKFDKRASGVCEGWVKLSDSIRVLSIFLIGLREAGVRKPKDTPNYSSEADYILAGKYMVSSRFFSSLANLWDSEEWLAESVSGSPQHEYRVAAALRGREAVTEATGTLSENLEQQGITLCQDSIQTIIATSDAARRAIERKRSHLMAQWKARYDELAALDQLFIAV